MSTGFIAGAKQHWIGTRDSNGYPMGSLLTPNSPVQDTLYTPTRRDCGFIQKGGMSIEPSIVTWFEGNQICGKLDLGVSEVGEFTTEFASKSFEYDDLAQGVTEASPLSGIEHAGVNTGETLLPDMFAGFGTYFRTSSSTTYFTSLYHFVQARIPDPAYGQGDGQNPNPLEVTFTPSKSDRLVFGDAVGSTYEHYRYVSHIKSTAGWMYTETYIGDGSTNPATFTLTYLPTSSDATGAADVRITLNGATQTVASVNTSTGLVTATGTFAADAIVVITYPTLFVTP